MKWFLRTIGTAVAFTGILVNTAAAQSRMQTGTSVPFSAEAIQEAPEQPPRVAKMHVADDRVRMEYSMDGNTLVEIIDLEAGRSYLVFPDRQQYMVRQAPKNIREMATQSSGQGNPCMGNPEAECRKLGKETLFGREAVKWEMLVEQQGRPMRSLFWIDTERQMPLRQLWPDGTVIEMVPRGMETVNGRRTEKWEMTVMPPEGEERTSYQWYDPELGIVIKETRPGGYARELQNIRLGEQDPEMFTVPETYEQVEPSRNQGGSQRREMQR